MPANTRKPTTASVAQIRGSSLTETCGASSSRDDEEAVGVLRARRAAIAAVVDDHSAGAEQVVRDIYGVTATHMFLKTRALLGAELTWIDAVLLEVETHGWSRFRLPPIMEKLDEGERP